MESASPLELLTEIGMLLDSHGIPYCVGGSWASGFYGEPRMTRDLDVIVEMGDSDVERLARALEPRYYVSRDAMREAIATRRAFNAIDPERGLKVDFFVLGDGAFDRQEFARRRAEDVGAGAARVYIKTPEDSILRKLLWYRQGGERSDQQWRDVLGLLAIGADSLDSAYLDLWATNLRIGDLLAKARSEAVR